MTPKPNTNAFNLHAEEQEKTKQNTAKQLVHDFIL
jgi:hypothetical protein